VSTPLRERPDAPLGTLIFRAGLLPAETIESALEEGVKTGKRLGEILTERGLISEVDLARLLAGQKGLEFVTLREQIVDPAAASLFREEQARLFRALPYAFDGGVPVVAIADPTDEVLMRNIREALGRDDAAFVVCARSELAEIASDVYSRPLPPAPDASPAPAPSPVPKPEDEGPAEHLNGTGQADAEPVVQAPAPEPLAEPGPEPQALVDEEPEAVAEAAPVPEPEPVHEAEPEPVLEAEPDLEAEPAPLDLLHEPEAEPGPAAEPAPLAAGLPEPEATAPAAAEPAPSLPEPLPAALAEPLRSPVEPAPPSEPAAPEPVAFEPESPALQPSAPEPQALPEAGVPPLEPEPLPVAEQPPVPTPEPEPVPEAPAAAEPIPLPQPPAPLPAPYPPAALQPERAAEPTVQEPDAPAPAPAPPPTAAIPWRLTIRLTNGERVEGGNFPDAESAKREARAIMATMADPDSAEWPFVSGRFLKPDTIVSVDIAALGAEQP
jgi:MshEN domain